MGKGKWIDKDKAVTFTLVHRPQNDPLIHDETAPSMVLAPTAGAGKTGKSGKSTATLDDLASCYGSDVGSVVRANEGEAAEYGIYYDDSGYDYMQHLREPGTLGSGAVMMEGAKPTSAGRRGGKQSLEQALREMDLRDQGEQLLDAEILPSKTLDRVTYLNQQDVQDSIAGLQPDMDPDLREALEALEDDAFVAEDENDDDIFAELTSDAREISAHMPHDDNRHVFNYDYGDDGEGVDDDDDGWESDATEKPSSPSAAAPPRLSEIAEEEAEEEKEEKEVNQEPIDGVQSAGHAQPPGAPQLDLTADVPNPDWMSDFRKFKQSQQRSGRVDAGTGAKAVDVDTGIRRYPNIPDGLSSVVTGTTSATLRRKKRKGALTNPSTYSMSSSALFRTEHQRLLDGRFDVRLSKLENDMDDLMSRSSAVSSVTTGRRQDFDAVVDEFLAGWKPSGQGKRAPRGSGSAVATASRGVAEYDELRRELGRPTIRSSGARRS